MRRAAVAGVTAILLALPVLALTAPPAAAQSQEARLAGGPVSATDQTHVSLDVTLYLPDVTQAPAVLLAHGFGGSKADLDARAQALRDRGYVVLAYSARGFGGSSGQISMDAPAYEVADAQALIDYLSTRSDVIQDSPGDPRVGIAGGSYGGALALLAAGYDRRVDAVAADITWNDLESSLFGQSAGGADAPLGVFKELWTGNLFGVGVVNRDGTVTECGRFTPQWCRAYTEAAADGVVTPSSSSLMRESSPASVTDRITAPTLISAGQADSLFPLAQADANAQQIMRAHPQTPVKMVWHAGGHDGGVDESERIDGLVADWFDTYLSDSASSSTTFEITESSGSISTANAGVAPVVLQAPSYPGIHGSSRADVTVSGPAQRILAPAGGIPAAITTVPGLGGALASTIQRPVPGQFAAFESAPLTSALSIVGASTVTIAVSNESATSDATLFASLGIVSPDGRQTLPSGLVSPVRITGVGPTPQEVTVQLPAVVATAGVGDRLRVVISTTDFAYRMPMQPQVYDIELADGVIAIPLVAAEPVAGAVAPYWWLVGAAAIVALVSIALMALRPRHPTVDGGSPSADDPLVITSLSKRYADGYLAVDDLTFTVRRGTVLGLLGPNGAGKTTTMRMVMGLIMPTDGGIVAFGQPVHAGAPVLARIGALVEGPGFLPHLTGRQNLDLYWRATGRLDDDAHLDEVLRIADLGSAIDKPVRAYSHGMRQRLGIAQAMLGEPDLLILDEPTNGLDPPQIKAMREVLHRYADAGRTVIISSHMLSEVEQTCTDVVVMHRGRLVGVGGVAELLGSHAGKRLEDVFLEIVGEDLTVGLP